MTIKLVPTTVACIMALSLITVSTSSLANDAGAFIGGVFATKLMQNSNRRANAEEEQAYAAQHARPVAQAAPAPASQSAEQRIAELDKLASGGYITPAEYKSKKKAIIDGM